MKVLVLGGDGFCGWPTSLGLSASGHQVLILDNLSRRKIDIELGVSSLTPITPIEKRISVWNQNNNYSIDFEHCDLAENYNKFLNILIDFCPDAIIHFAEQRAAPYSMKSSWHKRYTVNNNLSATNNILAAIVESDIETHLIHLGTMGVYGYGAAGMKIPEGYLKVRPINDSGEELPPQEILYPASPGSIYHMTKTQDQLLFSFYNKNDGVKITDLHQGIVWGCQTNETRMEEELINRFDYDGDYGTVLNRFLIQSAVGHPLTVHGTGGQTRAFINIQDTVNCIKLAVEGPDFDSSRVRIINQMTETFRVLDLANLVSELTGCDIEFVKNPRNEAADNDLHVSNETFLSLGLNPIKLSEGLLTDIREIATKYAAQVDLEKIPCVSQWQASH